VAHGVEQDQTGAGYAVTRLCSAFARQGIEVKLAALNLGGRIPDTGCETGEFELRRFPYIGPRKIGYSPQLRSFICDTIRDVDIVQTHFLWSYPVAAASHMAIRAGTPLTMGTHGALLPAAMAKSYLAKSAWYRIIDGPALEAAQCILATSEMEEECIRSRLTPKRLEVIPHGIDVPYLRDKSISVKRASEIITGGLSGKFVLYLGNLNPHKNLKTLVDAWSKIQTNWKEHVLLIVGSGKPGYIKRLQYAIESLKLGERVKIQPAVYGSDKWALLTGAEAVVVPSRSENFSFVVGEALSCGTPVVASQGCPWPILETEGFGRWVDTEDGLIAGAINEVLSWPTERREKMAQRAQDFVRDHFSWETVAKQYIKLYHDLVS